MAASATTVPVGIANDRGENGLGAIELLASGDGGVPLAAASVRLYFAMQLAR